MARSVQQRAGFTPLELLVVPTILGMLAAGLGEPAQTSKSPTTVADAQMPSVALDGANHVVPRPDPAQVELGRRLFFDPRLSADGTVSCASCHQPEHAYADPRPVSVGIGDRHGERNAPSLLDVAQRRSLFWDGRASSLRTQALQPLLNPREQGFHDTAALAARLAAMAREDVGASAAARADDIDATLSALVAFERTLRTADLPVDRLLHAPADPSVPAAVQRGFALFTGAGQCARCHLVGKTHADLTDDAYHRSAQGLGQETLRRLPESVARIREAKRGPTAGGLGGLVTDDADVAALGRFAVTGVPADLGAYRTPSLRSVALTAPYMHDGSVATLRAAMELELYRSVGDLRQPNPLSASEREDLLAFLESLAASSR